MPQELDANPFFNLLIMYTIPEALCIAADLVAVEGPTMVVFEALETTGEIGEMWSIAVSTEEDTSKVKAKKKIEAMQDNLNTAIEEQEKMAKELGQSFIDWHESVRKAKDARREAHNAALKKQNAAELVEAKRRKKNKEKKTSKPEVSEGRSKVKDGDPVDGTCREAPCALCEHGRFACYDKLDAKGKACAASKQPCWIPATGALKSVLKGTTERLDSTDEKLDMLEEKYEHLAMGLKAIKTILKDQGKCLASLVALQAEDQRVLEAIAEKFEVTPSKSTGKCRERRKRNFKPMVVSDVVQLEDEDEDEGPSKKRRRVEKAKPEVVASESEDEEAAEKAKGKEKEKEKEKAPKGPVDETLQSD
ncbi:hypothetical protein AURDEDRAFT_163503 [Auricularia subglabra TFB-10046 SS5]|nr:hypothetical protein AURDEDRAFT_163503 [Auricularia subglabra TFB-10046 SS5]